jgi:mono/diheme cytochrome c family protein
MIIHSRLVRHLVVGLLMLDIMALSGSAAQNATPRSSRDGVYTKQQAERGQRLFTDSCASCHGADLTGSEAGTPLVGTDFTGKWIGRDMGSLFEYTRARMPKDAPGTLKDDQYADLVAFVLSANYYPAGLQELKGSGETLRSVVIEAP